MEDIPVVRHYHAARMDGYHLCADNGALGIALIGEACRNAVQSCRTFIGVGSVSRFWNS
ncbi:MAG: hypothetical protein SPD11_13255 [Sphaerochaetaceae bacterium]|nr:hypothetical protein [Sphaerochaetaceae bacterium]